MKIEFSTIFLLVIATAQWIDARYLGCYQDDAIRILPDFLQYIYFVNSPARCTYLCQQLHYKYAAVQDTDQCFCSNDRPYELMKKSEGECNMNCPYSREICGGAWRNSVYSVDTDITPLADDGSYIGCYLDNENERTLNNYNAKLLEINNSKRCLHLCTALGYMYAGTEPDDFCFCGNTRPADSKKAEESECNVACPNSQESCGGKGRISISRTTVNSNAESIVTVSDERLSRNALGCFEDSEKRILPELSTYLQFTNSPKNCLYLCQQLRYRYAGVQKGDTCYCGNNVPSIDSKRTEAECQVSCPNSSERCGGNMHTYVYSTELFPNSGFKTLNENMKENMQ